MRAASRAYADAVRWVRESRRGKQPPAALARAAFLHSLVGGVGAMAVVGLLSPKSFGSPGSRALGSGWVTLSMGALIVAVGLHFLVRRRKIARVVELVRAAGTGMVADVGFEGATNALASCPAPLRSRFSLAWIWMPALMAGVAFLLAWSAAYFFVDAVIARFDVGLGQVLYGVGAAAASLVVFAAAAPRMQSWRIAYAAHRAAARH